jgi:hypothetical protein
MSGITGTTPSTLAPGGPSYASVVARQTPDPDILALKEELAELKTTIQAQQQQPQQPSAPPAPNPLRVVFHQIDIIGIAETKLDTKMPCVVQTCHQSARHHFDNSKLIMASSTRSYGSTYKQGGTLQLSRGSITGRVVASGIHDMGRWCWMTYNGSANR